MYLKKPTVMPQGNETTVSADEVLIHKSYMQASKEAGLIAF